MFTCSDELGVSVGAFADVVSPMVQLPGGALAATADSSASEVWGLGVLKRIRYSQQTRVHQVDEGSVGRGQTRKSLALPCQSVTVKWRWTANRT